ncbi:MAG: ferrochelatase, partial [Acidobacteriota bacterium]|nr:ferrochelatase [Acidobacteriota bacterium]
VVPHFYDHPAFLDSVAHVSRPGLDLDRMERVYFSFHGLPERHCVKSDDTGRHCLKSDNCCDRIVDANRNCYRAQCFATARDLGDRLDIPEEKRVICFQSRLGRTPWIKPYTDVILERDAKAGVRHAAILSPAFVADCLETLEELGIRALESWREAGGETLALLPCVNSDDSWAKAVLQIVADR